MITLLHGDYIEASRIEFNRLRDLNRGREMRLLDGKALEDSELLQSLQSSSLFGGDVIVFIERLFGKIGKQPKRIEALCLMLTSQSSVDVVIWEDKEIGASVIKHLGAGSRNQLFKLPVIIFQFMDSLIPGKSQAVLKLYKGVIASNPAEVVFSMMVKRIRQLIALSEGIVPAGLAEWQAKRLTSQAKSFTIEKLLAMYRNMHDIEVNIKTGNTPFSLSSHIEQVLTTL